MESEYFRHLDTLKQISECICRELSTTYDHLYSNIYLSDDKVIPRSNSGKVMIIKFCLDNSPYEHLPEYIIEHLVTAVDNVSIHSCTVYQLIEEIIKTDFIKELSGYIHG